VKYWEIIADELASSGWTWGCFSALDSKGKEIFCIDAYGPGPGRFIVRSDDKLTAFLELQAVIRQNAERSR
jgi:hypothetical protein